MTSLWNLFLRQCSREFVLHTRQCQLLINSWLFFLMFVGFFPLTIPPNTTVLHLIYPGVIWIAVLMAMFLSSERLFQHDYDDGVVEQWLVSGYPMSIWIIAKVLTHWTLNILPLLALSPVVAIIFSLSFPETICLILSLVVGSLSIMFLCALAAAFNTGLEQKSMVMGIILLPLTIPIMIFGSAAMAEPVALSGYLALLGAISLFASISLPFAIVGVIRIGLN